MISDTNIPSERRVYSVAEITRDIKMVLEEGFASLWVEGEISNFKRHSSGHFYFSIKDAEAQINCVMWRGRNQGLLFHPEDGMKVLLLGNVTVYERQGRYQIDVARMQPAGVGELQLAFEAMKRRLDEEGLFDSAHKRPLPTFPERIGVITSPTGAAIRDIVSVIGRRFPAVEQILAPVRVQGPGAAEEVAAAIELFNDFTEVDVLIVGRGGGSLEDLWAFNEEVVARAVFNSKIPVISAVGHEVDFSICDFVADVRAATPSAAAELAVPDRQELIQSLGYRKSRMMQTLTSRLERFRERLDLMTRSYAFRRPEDRIREYRLRLDDSSRALMSQLSHRLESEHSSVSRIEGRLSALNPEAVLARGYSITSRIRDGKVVLRAADLELDEKIEVRFHKGAADASVESIEQ